MRIRRRSCTSFAGVRFSRVQCPPLPLQAAGQTEQGGGGRGFAQGSRPRCVHYADRTRWRSSPGSTPSSKGGQPITGARTPRGYSLSLDHYLWKLALQVVHVETLRQAETLDRRPVFRQAQQAQERPLGVGDPASDAYLVKFAWTDIVRHSWYKGAASPNDPALADYWANGDERSSPVGQLHPAPARQAGCALSAPPGSLWCAGQPAQSPERLGTMVAIGHPSGDSHGLPRPPREIRPTATTIQPASYTPPADAGSGPASAGSTAQRT